MQNKWIGTIALNFGDFFGGILGKSWGKTAYWMEDPLGLYYSHFLNALIYTTHRFYDI